MIKETVTKVYRCRACNSVNIRKNGYNPYGSLQYYCKDCGAYKILNPKVKYSEARKEEIIKSYFERSSMRGVCRIFDVSRMTLSSWLKKKQKN